MSKTPSSKKVKPGLPIGTDINITIQQIKNCATVFRLFPRACKPKASEAHVAWLLLFCVISPVSRFGFATCIIGIRMPDFIIVGADSAGTFAGRNSVSSVKPVCKIYQDGTMFFAVSGLVDDPITRFNVARIVVKASSIGGTIANRAEASAQELRTLIPSEMLALKTADPQKYERIIRGEDDFDAVLFFGLENKTPVAIAFGFKATLSKNEEISVSVERRSCPGKDCPNGTYMFYLCDHAAIDRYLAEHKSTPPTFAPEQLVNFLIGLEVVSRPNDVQPPIDILRIDIHGPKWISKKPQCPEIQKEDGNHQDLGSTPAR
jgi:hypothetical protein